MESFLTTMLHHRLQNMAILMFKVKRSICLKYVSDLFYLQTTQYECSIRNSEFVVPHVNTVMYRKHSIKYFGKNVRSNITEIPCPGNDLWSRKEKQRQAYTDSQCGFCGCVALSEPSNYSFALTSMSLRDLPLL